MSRDLDFLVDRFETDVDFLASNWIMLGRPVILLPVSRFMLGDCRQPSVVCRLLYTPLYILSLLSVVSCGWPHFFDWFNIQQPPLLKINRVLLLSLPRFPFLFLFSSHKSCFAAFWSLSGFVVIGLGLSVVDVSLLLVWLEIVCRC